jgi:ATP-dependent Clp protease ATP-binding subunit ClpC
LGRKTKNNPVLIGKSGVGKTAIVEGLALRIAEGVVPPVLLGKRLAFTYLNAAGAAGGHGRAGRGPRLPGRVAQRRREVGAPA